MTAGVECKSLPLAGQSSIEPHTSTYNAHTHAMHHRAFYLCTSTPADSLDLKPVLNIFEMPGKSSQEALGYSKCFKYWYCLHVPAHCRLTGFLNTCASLHRSFDWKETGKDLVLRLGMGGSRCRCPPRGLQWIFYVWCVCVWGFLYVGCKKGRLVCAPGLLHY